MIMLMSYSALKYTYAGRNINVRTEKLKRIKQNRNRASCRTNIAHKQMKLKQGVSKNENGFRMILRRETRKELELI